MDPKKTRQCDQLGEILHGERSTSQAGGTVKHKTTDGPHRGQEAVSTESPHAINSNILLHIAA